MEIPERFRMYNIQGSRSKVWPELNRSALGRYIGITRAHISRILAGKITPNYKTASKLADALGISLDQLYNELNKVKDKVKTKIKKGE